MTGAMVLLLGSTTLAQDYRPDAAAIQKTVNYLASDKLKGRGPVGKGGLKASRYVAARFKSLGLTPRYQPFTFLREKTTVAGRNVTAYLDNGAAYTIIIGAHYDHLGKGELFNGKYPLGEIHNGADDNASGVAGLLELARHYVSIGKKAPVNFLFIAFGGEEMGLQGSKYYVAHPVQPLDQATFMLNMDMIGRYNPERGVGIGGYGSAAEWPEVFRDVQQEGIRFFTDPAGKGASDHHNFYMKGVPVLFFHTGGHDDYHKPADDAHKLQATAEAGILELAIQLIDRAAARPKLTYTGEK